MIMKVNINGREVSVNTTSISYEEILFSQRCTKDMVDRVTYSYVFEGKTYYEVLDPKNSLQIHDSLKITIEFK